MGRISSFAGFAWRASQEVAHAYGLFVLLGGGGVITLTYLLSQPPWLIISAGFIACVALFLIAFLAHSYVRAGIINAKKSSLRQERRQKLIDDCRDIIVNFGLDHNPQNQILYLEQQACYISIRAHLSPWFLKVCSKYMRIGEKEAVLIINGETRPRIMSQFAAELDRLERKWGLI